MGVEVLTEVGVAERLGFSFTFSFGVDASPLFWRFDENAFDTLSISGCLLDKSFMKALKKIKKSKSQSCLIRIQNK